MTEISFYYCESCEKSYKSYQGLYNHNKRHHGAGKSGDMKQISMTEEAFENDGYKFGQFGRPKAAETIQAKKERRVLEKTEEITAKTEREKPSYLTDDFDENVVEIPQPDSLPNAVKLLGLGGIAEDEDAPLSKSELKFQGKLARHFYMFLDSAISFFGKGYTGDNNYEIKRNKSDYDFMEESTVAMMEERGIRIPYSATAVWGITMAMSYGTPMGKMVIKRKKRGLRLIPNFFKKWGKKKDED